MPDKKQSFTQEEIRVIAGNALTFCEIGRPSGQTKQGRVDTLQWLNVMQLLSDIRERKLIVVPPPSEEKGIEIQGDKGEGISESADQGND